MENKFFLRLISVVFAVSLMCTAAIAAYATGTEDGQDNPTTSSSGSQTSSDGGDTPASSLITSDTQASSQQSASSENVSSNNDAASSKAPSVTSSKTVSSKKKNTTSSKKSKSSKKSATASKASKVSYTAQTTSYVDSSYDAGSISDKWDNDDNSADSSSAVSSQRKLSKHIVDPKREVLKWIWVPVVIGLACIGVLVYVNMYMFKGDKYIGKHSAKGKGASGRNKKYSGGKKNNAKQKDVADDFNDDYDIVSSSSQKPKAKKRDDDPFSADNFFNFDNDDNE